MMKRIVATLLAAALAMSAAGCGTQASGAPSNTQSPSASVPAATPAPAGDDDSLYGRASADIEQTVGALTAEYGTLTADITTYDDYVANADRVEAFYDTIVAETESLCIRLREYGDDYVDTVLAYGSTSDEMYDEMDTLYDDLYDDAGDDVYDEIYDDLMDDLYDAFYDGVLDEQPDDVEFSDWIDTHSNEYEMWVDCHSDIYSEVTECRSDIYKMTSDIRSELFSDDLDRAAKKLADFREDIQDLKDGAGGSAAASQSVPQPESAPDEGETAAPAAPTGDDDSTAAQDSSEALVDGMRPDFKNAMDEYESFMDEYCAFMEKYGESDGTDPSMLADYFSFLEQYTEMANAFDQWNSEDLNNAELSYYLEVQTRVNQKLLDVAQ